MELDFKNMGKWDQQLIDVLMKSRELSFDNGNQGTRKSKAAAQELSSPNKVQLIHNIIFS